MTDSNAPTTALPVADTAYGSPGHDDVYPSATPTPPRRVEHRDEKTQNPVADIKPEQPKRHPVAYAALALSIVSLVWLAVLSSRSGSDFQKVRVGTQDCVSVPQDSGPAALYCRTAVLTRTP